MAYANPRRHAEARRRVDRARSRPPSAHSIAGDAVLRQVCNIHVARHLRGVCVCTQSCGLKAGPSAGSALPG
jgi:hypothetical protein